MENIDKTLCVVNPKLPSLASTYRQICIGITIRKRLLHAIAYRCSKSNIFTWVHPSYLPCIDYWVLSLL
ncbi:hypothetical protein MA16_Dca028139 [Dendrobium catenatum]|uniref:Uncharacterized protein n=1 Tax=Dendrobium catenatum TaxID=906689 RepID=A0A2I0V9U7_9ASPA|nr:hypothetical protein MA16_Dca028139 [Dendrobium catenatum]